MADKSAMLPGVVYDISILDPKERVQAYLDAYRSDSLPTVSLASNVHDAPYDVLPIHCCDHAQLISES